MSATHPIIGVTGSSGAGTSTAKVVLQLLFKKLALRPAIVEGDAFHAYDRVQNREAIELARIRGENFSLLGPAGNHLDRLEALLKEYAAQGTGTCRRYLHTDQDAEGCGQASGTFTPWEPLPAETDILFYEGLHGGYVGEEADIASHMDLLIGVVPVINLEWIQKIRRDTEERGANPENVKATILRRLPDYVSHITPQFSRTDVNFQRVPLVDTSNPFAVREIPSQQESLMVIHLNEHTRLRADLQGLAEAVTGAYLSNEQTLIVPGPAMQRVMELMLAPAIETMAHNRRKLLGIY